MERPPFRDVAVSIVVFVVLVSVFVVNYATKAGWNMGVLWVFTVVAFAGGIAIAVLTTAPRRAIAILVLGIVVFYLGAGGGVCTDLGAPDPDAPHGVAYHPETNVLEFGEPIGGGYRCQTTPIWPLLVIGYAMTTFGLREATTNDNSDSPST